jgi:aminopeptidase-like protein
MGLVDFYVTMVGDEVILSYAKDKNGNGEIERDVEPVILKSISLENFEISDFISEDEVKRIQSIID